MALTSALPSRPSVPVREASRTELACLEALCGDPRSDNRRRRGERKGERGEGGEEEQRGV
jgi:hypothetical protein